MALDEETMLDLNNMITYDLHIKFDPLVFALRRKADAKVVDRLRDDLAAALATLGAQTTQLDLVKRMLGSGAAPAAAAGDASGGGSGGGGGGGGGGSNGMIMEIAAQVGALAAEVKGLREQRAVDAALIEDLQRATGTGGADGYSTTDQLTDRMKALESNIASILKKVSRELQRSTSAGSASPNTRVPAIFTGGDEAASAASSLPSPSGFAPAPRGFDYGLEIRKLGERLEQLVTDTIPVGVIANKALALAEAASKTAAEASKRVESAEVSMQAINAGYSATAASDAAAMAAASAAATAAAVSAAAAAAAGGAAPPVIVSGGDTSALQAQIAALHARLEGVTRKQAEESAAERTRRGEELKALKAELSTAMAAQTEQMSAKLEGVAASAASHSSAPTPSLARQSSAVSVSAPSAPRQGATVDSLTARVDIITARVQATETGLATTAKALVNLKNNVENMATTQALVTGESPAMPLVTQQSISAKREAKLKAAAAASSDDDEDDDDNYTAAAVGGKAKAKASAAAQQPAAEGAEAGSVGVSARAAGSGSSGSSASSASSGSSGSGSGGIDAALFHAWAESITSSVAAVAGAEAPSGGDGSGSGGSSGEGGKRSSALSVLAIRAAALASNARPAAARHELHSVSGLVEAVDARVRVLMERAGGLGVGGAGAAELAALQASVAALQDSKADRAEVEARLADVHAALGAVSQRVNEYMRQLQLQLRAGSDGGSPTQKDRGALSSRPLLRDLKCLSCDQPLTHGLPSEAGGHITTNSLLSHLPVSKAWMFSQASGGTAPPPATARSASPTHREASQVLPGLPVVTGSGAYTMLPNGHVLQRPTGLRPLSRAGLSAVQLEATASASDLSGRSAPATAHSARHSGGSANQGEEAAGARFEHRRGSGVPVGGSISVTTVASTMVDGRGSPVPILFLAPAAS